jgi:hypothetical protein
MDLLNFAVGASQCSLIDNKNMLTKWAWPLWRKAAVRSCAVTGNYNHCSSPFHVRRNRQKHCFICIQFFFLHEPHSHPVTPHFNRNIKRYSSLLTPHNCIPLPTPLFYPDPIPSCRKLGTVHFSDDEIPRVHWFRVQFATEFKYVDVMRPTDLRGCCRSICWSFCTENQSCVYPSRSTRTRDEVCWLVAAECSSWETTNCFFLPPPPPNPQQYYSLTHEMGTNGKHGNKWMERRLLVSASAVSFLF